MRVAAGLQAARRRAAASNRRLAVAATLIIAAGYVAVYTAAGHIATADFARSVLQFWVGDAIGILVATPALLLALGSRRNGRRFRARWETLAQGAAVLAALRVTFGIAREEASKFFYVLFLPLIWVSVRHGISGAAAALVSEQRLARDALVSREAEPASIFHTAPDGVLVLDDGRTSAACVA